VTTGGPLARATGRIPRGRIDDVMTVLEDWVMRCAFLGALALGVTQVILRNGFNFGFTWIETDQVALTILAAMVGGSRAIARGLHVRVVLLVNVLPATLKMLVACLATLGTLVYCAVLALGGYEYVQFLYSAGVVSVESGLPAWVFALVVPFTMAMFVIRYLQTIPAVLCGGDSPVRVVSE
jgi:C4-dicarboxylate transporter DctQ subunit